MYIFGSVPTVLEARRKAGLFSKQLSYLQKSKRVVSALPVQCANHSNPTYVKQPSDFGEDGGCKLRCTEKLDCGHRCHRQCHPKREEFHRSRGLCLAPCRRLLECEHPCKNICGADCGP